MERKCRFCDKKGQKSINTETDDYVKTKYGYAHSDCYKIYLTTRKRGKVSPEMADAEILSMKEGMAFEQRELQCKDELMRHLTEYYNMSITDWQYQKLAKVNDGTFKPGMKEGILYSDLLQMWKHPKFLRKLNKIAFKKNVAKENRLDYDIPIVVGEYDKYKEAKLKKIIEENHLDDMQKRKDVMKKTLERATVIVEEENDEIDILDMID